MKHSYNFIDLTGQVFGRLTVLKYVGKNKGSISMWKCVCSCREKCAVTRNSLTSGTTNSCGCIKSDLLVAGIATRTHGQSHINNGKPSPEYKAWGSMKERCTNPNLKCYPRYGGRGICICTRWFNSFAAFLSDMGRRPKGKTLDRTNNNGHYIPLNTRWETPKHQANNRRQKGSKELVIPFVDVL